MTDLERRVAATLDRKAGQVGFSSAVPPHDLRSRARRRQSLTVSVAGLVAVALGLASFAGVRAALEGPTVPAAPARQQAVRGIATAGVHLQYPQTWFFLQRTSLGLQHDDEKPGSDVVWPLFQVTNFAPEPQSGSWCPDHPGATRSFPPDGVMLYVQQEVSFFGPPPSAPDWPVPLPAGRISARSGDVCATPTTVRWRAAARRFGAIVVAGSAASSDDRAGLLRAFRSMTFEPRPLPAVQSSPLGPKLAILEGVVAGTPWTFWVQNTTTGVCRDLEFAGRHIDECPLYPLHLPTGDVASMDAYDTESFDGSRVVLVTGLVVAGAARATLELADGRTVEARIGRLPEDFLSPNFQVSVYAVALEEPAPRPFLLRVEDESGRVLGTARSPAD